LFYFNEINAGNGIENMKKRAKELNGTLKIKSEKNKGTLILLTCKI
jgi:signal transduction histidine kinase